MANIHFSESARSDLLQAWLFVAEENIQAADRLLDTIEEQLDVLALQPLMGRARPDLAGVVRSWPTSTPYIIFYEPESEGITIIRVLQHARDVNKTLF